MQIPLNSIKKMSEKTRNEINAESTCMLVRSSKYIKSTTATDSQNNNNNFIVISFVTDIFLLKKKYIPPE